MKVIFFDGICGLCNGFIDFILKIDQKKIYSFSTLQSPFAVSTLPKEYTSNLGSVVFLDEEKIYTRALAVLKILIGLGGVWRLAGIGYLLPEFIINYAYDIIAKNRYKLFGKKETCRIPSQEERTRFILK